MQCRLCGGELSPWLEMPIDGKKDQPTPFKNLLRCDDCRTGMLTPQPKADQITELYQVPAYYTHGESHIREVQSNLFDKVLTKLSWKLDRPVSFAPKDMAEVLPKSGNVCDLGCGDGSTLKQFKELGFGDVGVEPDPCSRELATDSALTVLSGTAEMLPHELVDRQFDLVLMRHSLEHCIDPGLALANAYRLTREGGYLYCEVPNCGCVHFETLTGCSETFDSPRHLWFFTANGLRRAIELNGFVFQSWRFEGFTRHHLPSWRAWEVTIFDRLAKRGQAKRAQRHTFFNSLWILTRSAFAPAHRKYDCVGVVARKLSNPQEFDLQDDTGAHGCVDPKEVSSGRALA